MSSTIAVRDRLDPSASASDEMHDAGTGITRALGRARPKMEARLMEPMLDGVTASDTIEARSAAMMR